MSENDSRECTCGECSCAAPKARRKCRVVSVAVILAALVLGVVWAVRHADAVRAEEARLAAEAAERARVEGILAKPLADWTDADKAEFADAYETRRQEERASDHTLWTKEEKKSEWWSYAKIRVSEQFRRSDKE